MLATARKGALVASVDCAQCALQSHCLIGRLAPATREALGAHIHERKIAAQHMLVQQNDRAHTLRIVKTGQAKCTRTGPDGRDRVIGFFGPGLALGLFAFFEQPNIFNAWAYSDVRVCEVAIDKIQALRQSDPQLEHRVTSHHFQYLNHLADWAAVANISSVAGRLSAALLQLGQIQRSLMVRLPSQTDLALQLGITRETVARIFKQLEAQGAVQRVDRVHCQLDVTQLSACAQLG